MIANLKPYPEYKDSGLPWLGQVPGHWGSERAKWLFTNMDRPVNANDEVVTCFRDGTVTLRKNRRLRGFTEATHFFGYQGIRKGDLVIHGMDAFAGAIGVSDSDGKGTPVYNVCHPRLGVNAYYYAHLIRKMSQSQWILALAKGIRERSTDFRFKMFGDQRVPLPPPDEQAAIVRFLDHMNGKIERAIRAKRKMVKLLNEQKQAIIHRAVTRGLDPSVKLKDSGVPWLGEIPEHWEVVPLKYLCLRVQNGSTPSTSEPQYYTDGTVPWYGPSSIGVSSQLGAPVRRLTKAAFEHGRARLISGPAVLVVVIGATAGKIGLLAGEGATNQQITSFELRQDVVAPEFAIHQLRSSETWLKSTASTATIPILDSGVVNRLPMALPPICEQKRILASVSGETLPLATAICNLEREITLLREYRTRLVADVVTGKLDVRAAAADLPEQAEPLPADDAPPDEAEDGETMENEE